ncbi:MAG TPA: hypothetical protein HPP77_01590 [Candidatus Hydrogenedentes bacterium]|nr:hypothetical protein [Candidatus Hydrogenedentota bacterium]
MSSGKLLLALTLCSFLVAAGNAHSAPYWEQLWEENSGDKCTEAIYFPNDDYLSELGLLKCVTDYNGYPHILYVRQKASQDKVYYAYWKWNEQNEKPELQHPTSQGSTPLGWELELSANEIGDGAMLFDLGRDDIDIEIDSISQTISPAEPDELGACAKVWLAVSWTEEDDDQPPGHPTHYIRHVSSTHFVVLEECWDPPYPPHPTNKPYACPCQPKIVFPQGCGWTETDIDDSDWEPNFDDPQGQYIFQRPFADHRHSLAGTAIDLELDMENRDQGSGYPYLHLAYVIAGPLGFGAYYWTDYPDYSEDEYPEGGNLLEYQGPYERNGDPVTGQDFWADRPTLAIGYDGESAPFPHILYSVYRKLGQTYAWTFAKHWYIQDGVCASPGTDYAAFYGDEEEVGEMTTGWTMGSLSPWSLEVMPQYSAGSCAHGNKVKYVNRDTYPVAFWDLEHEVDPDPYPEEHSHLIGDPDEWPDRVPYEVHDESSEEKPQSIYGDPDTGMANVISSAKWTGSAPPDVGSFQLIMKVEVTEQGEPTFPGLGELVWREDGEFPSTWFYFQGAGELCVGDAIYNSYLSKTLSSAAYIYTRGHYTIPPYAVSKKCIAASRRVPPIE